MTATRPSKLIASAYIGSYALSILGNSIAAIALPLIVLRTTGSVMGAGTLAAATAIPAFAAGLTMGVVIDRVNRRSASITTDLISAASVAALPLIDLVTGLNLGWFIAFGIIGSLGDVPGLTARDALVPGIVRATGIAAERLLGLKESLGAVAMLVGPAVAGVLLSVGTGPTVLWVTAATSASAALLTCVIPRSVGQTLHDAAVPVSASPRFERPGPGTGQPHAGRPGAHQAEGSDRDARQPDAGQTTARRPDGGQTDGRDPDGRQSDGCQTDTRRPDAGRADVPDSDARQPDAGRPAARRPSGGRAEGSDRDGCQPGGHQPDARRLDRVRPAPPLPVRGTADVRQPDGDQPAARPCGGQADGNGLDGRQPDAGQADGRQPDTRQPDTRQPDAGRADVRDSDARQPDSGRADARRTGAGQPAAGQGSQASPAETGDGGGGPGHGIVRSETGHGIGWADLREGWQALLASRYLVAMTALSLVSVIVVGALQALVFPVYFTVIGKPGLAGFVLSCLAAGMLIGAGVYAAVGMRGSRRTWFAIGLIGTAIGFAISATLASPLVVFVGATLVGLSSGMFSALIGVLGIERIPEALRGRIMGTQNSLMTLAPAIGIFGAAVLTSQAGVHAAAYTAAGIWLVLAVVALVAPPLRDLNARVAPTGGCDGRADRAASGSCHASRR